ncbi:arsenic transporter [Paenibacillus darwinianus]|uniref:Arsenic transporter n=1 Tax=Paenibacillus darwinianus TaxID=1380763 RepID=A0A9W5S0X6_9BACL|nr:arsenic transporter [Paenibacillus darwinianus]EXX88470.1 arsenic transporter [Paenibacillus darwinianus]EXX89282.1 arsenic transporter [Paenibacillus darwinianus]EXX89998.1 arsenic transporter [Paenibacillus darwinianus]
MFGSVTISLTIIAFMLSMILILWRPNGLNEAIPATAGALLVVLSGSVTLSDLGQIGATISSASITIMATIVMAIVLESFGFFYWAAEGLAARSKGSGIRLFWYVNLLCFLMTLFFNNDGSILITTPILLILLERFRLKNHEKIPYLLSGALIATASSAPIGVSNIVNLIALEIVGMDLYMHTLMMFVPATVGLLFLVFLLFLCFRHRFPRKLPRIESCHFYHGRGYHPLKTNAVKQPDGSARGKFMRNILLFVFAVRVSLFAGSYLGIPVELVAVTGSLLLLGWRWLFVKISPADMLTKTPWHILVFAFGMYVMIYGLNNIGLADWLITVFEPSIAGGLLNASIMMGTLLSALSIFVNNHPALMIGTLALTQMNLDPLTLKIAYLASVIGSDMGALLLPIGTLASLIWLHILKRHKVKIHWKDYVRVTVIVIPPTVLFTLYMLALWVQWLY